MKNPEVQLRHKTYWKMPNKTNMVGADGVDLRVCYSSLIKIQH